MGMRGKVGGVGKAEGETCVNVGERVKVKRVGKLAGASCGNVMGSVRGDQVGGVDGNGEASVCIDEVRERSPRLSLQVEPSLSSLIWLKIGSLRFATS